MTNSEDLEHKLPDLNARFSGQFFVVYRDGVSEDVKYLFYVESVRLGTGYSRTPFIKGYWRTGSTEPLREEWVELDTPLNAWTLVPISLDGIVEMLGGS